MGISPPLDTTINEGDSGALGFFDAIAAYLNGLPVMSSATPAAVGTSGSAGSSGAWSDAGHVHAGVVLSSALPQALSKTPTAGAVGAASDAGHRHSRKVWAPSDNGLFSASDDPGDVNSSNILGTTGNLLLVRQIAGEGGTIGNVDYGFNTVGSGGTATQNVIGIYSAAGVLLGHTGDQTANFASSTSLNGRKAALIPDGPGLTFAPGDEFFVAILLNGGTAPNWWRVGSANTACAYGLTGAALRWGVITGPFTALPNPITPSAMTSTAAYWAGTST